MDNSGILPDPSALYSPPLRGRLAVQGLQTATVADLVYGGLPSRLGSSEPAGDAGEGFDLPNPLQPYSARGRGDTYQPHPYLPTSQHLDYMHKFTSTTLLTVGVIILLVLLVRAPRAAGNLVTRAGLGKLGAA